MSRDRATEITRFILVGGSSTGLYFLLLWLLRGPIASTALLTACCYLIGMVYNYALQSWFTFRAGPPTWRSMGRFVVMHLGAMATNSALMAGLVDGLRLPLFGAQVMVTGIVSVLVYLVSKGWVYRPS